MEELSTVDPGTSVVAPVTADQIMQAHDQVMECTRSLANLGNQWMQKASIVGELLTRKKAEVGHGNFLPWLAENVKAFGDRTAAHYMKAYRYSNTCTNLDKTLTSYSIRNLRQITNLIDGKSEMVIEERPKPPFIIKFNIEPSQFDEYQRKDFIEHLKPALDAGLIH